MEVDSFQWRNNVVFTSYTWMANPDLLPRSKTATFFLEQAGRSSTSEGPPLDGTLSSPPASVEIVFLIHLSQYQDWTPQTENSPSPDPSGFASSTGSTLNRPFPFFKNFPWTPGVLESQPRARPVRMLTSCHGQPMRTHPDEDPEEDG
jgi:hypothetical protein